MDAREQATLADLVRGMLTVTREARATCTEISHAENLEAAGLDRLILLAETFLRQESLKDADYEMLRMRAREWDVIHENLWPHADRGVSLPERVRQLVERAASAESKLAAIKALLP